MRLAGTWVLTAMALLGTTARADGDLDPFLFFAEGLEATSESCEPAGLDASISVEDLMQRGIEGLGHKRKSSGAHGNVCSWG